MGRQVGTAIGARHRGAASGAGAVAGQARLAMAKTEMVPGVEIRIVQPSVAQREKWRPENQARIFQDHLDLSVANPDGSPGGVTHVVWPEAAMPFLPLDHAGARAAIGRMLPPVRR
jgi:apolipoprotein N-acyltransferase